VSPVPRNEAFGDNSHRVRQTRKTRGARRSSRLRQSSDRHRVHRLHIGHTTTDPKGVVHSPVGSSGVRGDALEHPTRRAEGLARRRTVVPRLLGEKTRYSGSFPAKSPGVWAQTRLCATETRPPPIRVAVLTRRHPSRFLVRGELRPRTWPPCGDGSPIPSADG